MATPYRAPSGYIDFTAIGRGRRDRQLEAQADEVYEFNRDQRQRDMELRQWDRQAADYLAPLLGNRQAAVDAGVSPIDFFVQQREQMLADPGYQALDPQAQLRAVNQLQQSALVTAQQAQQRGDLGAANRLMEAFGVYPANTQVDLAAQSGDAGQIVQAIQQQYGSDLGFDPTTDTVMIAGQRRPVLEALPNIYKARSVLGAYPAAGAALQTETQLQQALRLAQDQRNREAATLRLQLLGQLAQTGNADALRELQRQAGIVPQVQDWSGVTSGIDSTAQLVGAAVPAAAAPSIPGVAPVANPVAAANALAQAGTADVQLGSADEQLAGALRSGLFGLVGGQLVPSDPMLQLVQLLRGTTPQPALETLTPVQLQQQQQDVLQQIADLRVRRSRARAGLYAADPSLSTVQGVSAQDEQALLDQLTRIQALLNGGANGSR